MNYKYILSAVCAVSLLFSCSKDDNTPNKEQTSMKKVTELSNDNHSVVMSSETGTFVAGFNNISVEVKDKSGNSVAVSEVSWMPMMTMVKANKMHSCPFTPLNKSEGNTYKGSVLFQMASMGKMGYWDMTVNYTAGGKKYTAKGRIEVVKPKGKNEWVTVKDGYVLGVVQPNKPEVGVNDLVIALYKMNMNSHGFDVVSNYKILIDPRMPDPSMKNHSSPNNVDLTQGKDGYYHGKVNFTMSGYWKINLRLQDENKNVILGEEVTDTNESSSLHLDIEF